MMLNCLRLVDRRMIWSGWSKHFLGSKLILSISGHACAGTPHQQELLQRAEGHSGILDDTNPGVHREHNIKICAVNGQAIRAQGSCDSRSAFSSDSQDMMLSGSSPCNVLTLRF